MTDKEKAKAYDEALDRMKYVVVVPKDKKALQALKETIFPELADSEDERIRKELANFLRSPFIKENLTDEKVAPWIAYLEKPKEPENVSASTMIPSCWEVEQKEQKSAEWAELQSEFKNINEAFEDGKKEVIEHPEKYGLCKPLEWSEEDENNLELVIDCIYKLYPDPVMKYKLKDWLKSLRPVKQEWSDEDEDKLYQIIEILLADKEIARRENSQHNDVLSKAYNELISWLKGLRPSKDCSSCAKHLEGYISGRSDAENKLLEQFGALVTPEDELRIKPRWKPSEEQMQYLLAVINDPNNAGAESCHLILESLYNDLKEL